MSACHCLAESNVSQLPLPLLPTGSGVRRVGSQNGE